MQIGSVVRWRNTDTGIVVKIDGDYAEVRFCPLEEHKVKLIHQSELEVIKY